MMTFIDWLRSSSTSTDKREREMVSVEILKNVPREHVPGDCLYRLVEIVQNVHGETRTGNGAVEILKNVPWEHVPSDANDLSGVVLIADYDGGVEIGEDVGGEHAFGDGSGFHGFGVRFASFWPPRRRGRGERR